MKLLLIPFIGIAMTSGIVMAENIDIISVDKAVSVNTTHVDLNMNDFTPITQSQGSRKVVIGYEAYIDVLASDGIGSLGFHGEGKVSARWFSSNFGLVAKMSCSGIPVGMSKVYGERVNGVSHPAAPTITEIRHNIDECRQIKVELVKQGSLSRQFYTRIESIDFSVSVYSNLAVQGEI